MKDTIQGYFLLYLFLLPDERAGSVQCMSLWHTSKVCIRIKSRLKPVLALIFTSCGKCCAEIFVSLVLKQS